ncbi:hypothetical protein GGR28_001017 [Lewinella aquimaris]|uniref:Uncharacterized protein n=1 Tax=Neolewinella aquimaris TaxID=1835722 RepID=A0A840DYR2_9BACT|nr:hypothetical protein [Neolewinella aquimaris]MBB4078404.1 hypothetical protein [Neolewinella aquimaris]
MKQEKHLFDELIRQRIASLPPPPPRGWDELERKLDAPAPVDQSVASKLATLAPVAPSGSWDAFEVKLAAAEKQVDQAIADGLHHSAPSAPSGWALLAARLELIGQRREMVFCLKVSEAALLLSALLLFLRFGDQSPTRPLALDPSLTPATAFPISQSAPSAATAPLAFREKALGTTAPTNNALATDLSRAPSVEMLPQGSPRPVPTSQTSSTNYRTKNGLSSTAAIERFSHSANVLPLSVQPALQLPPLVTGEAIRYYLNVFTSPIDFNQVVTLENPSLGIQPQSTLSTGHSFGVLVDITQGDNALQTGLIYGYRSYVPTEILSLENVRNQQEDADRIRFGRLTYKSVSIPLNYERELHTTERWRFAAGLGVSMNVILSSEFKLGDGFTMEDLDRQIREFREQRRTAGNIPFEGRERGTNTILSPEAGYLEGGSLLDNSSLYLSGNFRVERLLTDQWSLYFSPTVTRLITVRTDDGGKGPLEDRIHNTMLRLGTRIRLTDK